MSRLRLVAHGLLTGVLVGVAGGAVDAWTTPHAFLGRQFLGVAVLAWVICGAAGGLALGLFAALLCRRAGGGGARAPHSLAAWITASSAVAAAWFLLVVHANVVWLGSDTGRQALLFDAGTALAALAAAWSTARLLGPAFERPGHPLRRLLAGAAGPLLAAAAILVLAAVPWRGGLEGAGPPPAAAPAGAPDVVLVLIDTLRRDHLSAEGYERRTTPALDELAARGARFPEFASQSCYTKPAVASLLTSLYPSGHGVGHLRTVLGEDRLTLAEIFHAAGWRTAKFVSNTILGAEFGFAQGTERFSTLPVELVPRTRLGYALFRLGEGGREVPGRALLARALAAAERTVTGAPGAETLSLPAPAIVAEYEKWRRSVGEGPAFAYLHFMEPHAPYRPLADVASRFEGAALEAEHPPTTGLFLPFARAAELPASRRLGLVRAYDAEVAGLDETLGGFFARLASSGRPVIVAVTSDHGEEFYEHGGWGHGQSLHEELLRVPFVIAGRGVPQGVVPRGPAQLVDVAPTLLDLCGIPVPVGLAGRSLVPAMTAAAAGDTAGTEADREHFAEIVYGDTYWARSLRAGPWKAIVARLGEDARVQLFDLAADPGELRDLSDSLGDRAAAMVARIEELAAAAKAGAGAGTTAEFDPVTRERLRALGYVE
ncbi:MAG: sulfatase [Candidatus Eiseniibacteriota bacterium]